MSFIPANAEIAMLQQFIAHLPDPIVKDLDWTATHFRRSRVDVIRLAVGCYLESSDDLSVATGPLRVLADSVFDLDQARCGLLDTGKGARHKKFKDPREPS